MAALDSRIEIPDELKLYTQQQVAAILGISDRQIRKLQAEGKLRKVVIGEGTVRYRHRDLLALIEG